jgi:hypothetical protein
MSGARVIVTFSLLLSSPKGQELPPQQPFPKPLPALISLTAAAAAPCKLHSKLIYSVNTEYLGVAQAALGFARTWVVEQSVNQFLYWVDLKVYLVRILI